MEWAVLVIVERLIFQRDSVQLSSSTLVRLNDVGLICRIGLHAAGGENNPTILGVEVAHRQCEAGGIKEERDVDGRVEIFRWVHLQFDRAGVSSAGDDG